MEISYPCIENCFNAIKKCNRCSTKIAAYFISVLEILILLSLLVLFNWIPDKILYNVFYHFEDRRRTQIILSTCIIHLMLTCFLLVFGIYKDKSWCVLLWIITMIVYWNANLVASVISIVNYIMDGLESEREKTTNRTLTLFFIQSVWLIAIAYMWYYWKTMHATNNVANLVQYVAERGSSLRMFQRSRTPSADTAGNSASPATAEPDTKPT